MDPIAIKPNQPHSLDMLTYHRESGEYTGAPRPVVLNQEGPGGPVRLVLGGGEADPDLFIERVPEGWAVVLHPSDGADAVFDFTIKRGPDGLVVHFEDERGRELCADIAVPL